MSRPALLEVFEYTTQSAEPAVRSKSRDWEEGFAEGRADALGEVEAQNANLTAEFVQSLSDMGFAYAEAKADILAGLSPMFDALITSFLPHLADLAFVDLIRDRLMEHCAPALESPVQLRVSPMDIVAVSDALSGQDGLSFTCRSDPVLGKGQALIGGTMREELVDLTTVLETARSALSTLATQPHERTRHG